MQWKSLPAKSSAASEGGFHWKSSCAINACLLGDPGQPLCARAWEGQWRLFIACMAICWRDPNHCRDIHARWIANNPSPTR
jgi:hypothetical protein